MKKFYVERLRSLSLAEKFILLYIVVIAIPVISAGIYIFTSMKKTVRQEALADARLIVQKAKSGIDRKMEACYNFALTIKSNTRLMGFISREYESSVLEWLELDRRDFYSIEAMRMNTEINNFRLFMDNPNLNLRYNKFIAEENVRQEDWWKSVVREQKNYLWRLSHTEEKFEEAKDGNGPEVVSLYMELKYPDERHLGVLEVNMKSEVFLSELYETDNIRNSAMCLMKNNDIYFPMKDKILTEINTDLAEFAGMLAISSVGQEGEFVMKVNGHELLVVYNYIDKPLDGYIYSVIPADEVTGRMKSFQNLIIVLVLVIIVVLSVITYLIISLMLKKVRTVIASMRKVQQGILDIEIPVYGNDEISQLAGHFRKMIDKINSLISTVIQKEASKRLAEIRVLESQINRHFIYNVLENIKMMAEIKGEYEISDTVTSLGRLMRYCMTWGRQYVPLREEIENIINYVGLVNIRYDNKVRLVIDADEQFLSQKFPKMMLQPLVENSINHGFETRGYRGIINLKVYEKEDRLVVEVKDNGVGITPQKLSEIKQNIGMSHSRLTEGKGPGGIGLLNIHERLKFFYDAKFNFEIDSIRGEYTRIAIIIVSNINKLGDAINEESTAG